MVKQYKAQVKVTELWLDDLGKHNEENASLNQVPHLQHFLNKYYTSVIVILQKASEPKWLRRIE